MQAAAYVFPGRLSSGVSALIFVAVTAFILTRNRFLLTLTAAALIVIVPLAAIYKPDVVFSRSFFGVNRVVTEGDFRKLAHGTTIHGAMRLANGAGEPAAGRPEPLTYYTFEGPMGEAIAAARATAGRPLEVGVIGLGTGSLACHARPGETWRFYEIDAEVVRIARDPALFRFLSACLPDAPVVLGDARLTVPRGGGAYDVLVVDAFSSDAIPMHLLNVDAVGDFEARLRDGGVAVFHISNRHLDLRQVLARVAAARGLVALVRSDPVPADAARTMRTGSVVVTMARPQSPAIAALEARGYARLDPDLSRRPWTDDFANIIEAMADKWRSGR
jgi:spermidine synthase